MSDELKVVAWECIAKPDGWNGLPPKEHVAAMVDDVRADNPYWEAYKALVYRVSAERLLSERDARIAQLEREMDEMDAALRDCLVLASRHRHEEWAQHIMRFCSRAGVVPSPLRGES